MNEQSRRADRDSEREGCVRRLTIRLIVRDLVERFFSLERGWLLTVRELTTRPGTMIARYVSTDRVSYANPFAYLLLGTLVSVVTQKTIGFQDWAVKHTTMGRILSPAQVALQEDAQALLLQHLLYVSLGILIPFAALLRLLFKRSGYNLAEMTVFSLYTGGHLSLIGVLTLPLVRWIDIHPALVGFPIALAFMGYAAVGFFGGRFLTVLKASIAYVVAVTFYMGVMIAATMAFVVFFLSSQYRNLDDWTLVSATDQRQVEVVKSLLAGGADPDLPVQRTALQAAAEGGLMGVVELLFDHGASVDATDHLGRSAIFYAARSGHRDIARRLLEMGANATLRASDGSTPLMSVARTDDIDLARELIVAGCDVNAMRTGHTAVTALMLAARNDSGEMVDLLLEHGADPSAANDKGETAADLAGSTALADRLRSQ